MNFGASGIFSTDSKRLYLGISKSVIERYGIPWEVSESEITTKLSLESCISSNRLCYMAYHFNEDGHKKKRKWDGHNHREGENTTVG